MITTKKTKKATVLDGQQCLAGMAVSASIRAIAHHCKVSEREAELMIRETLIDSLNIAMRGTAWQTICKRGYTREQARIVLAMLRDAGARGWGMHSLVPGVREEAIWNK